MQAYEGKWCGEEHSEKCVLLYHCTAMFRITRTNTYSSHRVTILS